MTNTPHFGYLQAFGQLNIPEDQTWRAPDLRAARIVQVAIFPLVTYIFGSIASVLIPIIPKSIDELALLAAGGFALLRIDNWTDRGLAFGLLVVLTLFLALFGGLSILFLLPMAFYMTMMFKYVNNRSVAAQTEKFFLELQPHLPGWKAFYPKHERLANIARLLVSPKGEQFLLGTSPSVKKVEYQQEHVYWEFTADTLNEFVRSDAPAAQQAQRVLWVVKPADAVQHYEPHVDQGVSVVIASAADLAQQLGQWEQMKANLHGHDASAEGRAVEAQAVEELRRMLPAGWQMDTSVLLAQGGDADIVLRDPAGHIFVIDVKSRRDRMDLQKAKGDRAKSWQELHDQVTLAARQIDPGALGVLWQPRTDDAGFRVVGELLNVRGGAGTLLEALNAQAAAKGGQGQQQAASAPRTPYEVLGLAEGASLEEVKAAYKTLAKQYHPDRVASLGPEFRELAEQRMKDINAAYAELTGAGVR